MRRKLKYRLPNSRGSSNSGFIWLLVILAFAGLAWIWWNAGKTSTPKKITPKKYLATSTNNVPRFSAIQQTKRTLLSGFGASTNGALRPVQNLIEAQFALDRRGISSGSLDGRFGSQTRAAIRAFQRTQRIPVTGELDVATKSRLLVSPALFENYSVTSNDLARLQPLSKTWLGKSQQSALEFESVLEMIAERTHAHPSFIRKQNPDVNWTNISAGCVLKVPVTTRDEPSSKAAFVRISLGEKTLEAFDQETNLIAHFPCSIAQKVEKRPVGELRVEVIAPNPNYTFNPEIFPESPEAQQIKTKLVLPPGPNNPVGVVWIGLDKPGYGMHGTPNPEAVGRTESHGCFRLANWNAAYLLKLTWIGMPVYVEP